jgi:glycosyltransferase involved in cell wall biosynthesis
LKPTPTPFLESGGRADVALLLEGTYPYVRGGVSAWVHQLILGLPDLTFSVIFVGGARERRGPLAYDLPPNVVHLEEHYLSLPRQTEPPGDLPGDPAFFAASEVLHDGFRTGAPASAQAMDAVVDHLVAEPERCRRDFLYSRRAWSDLTSRYEAGAPTRSFLEYFWTVRSMHAPLFTLAAAAARVPPARVLHVVSTGFAGFLATLLRRQRRCPLVITEHGIYTKERRIELLQADWVFDDGRPGPDTSDVSIGYFRQLWIGFFERIGRLAYEAADAIVTLYEGNRQRQIADGAPAEKTSVLPNGIALDRFRALRARRPEAIPPVIALIGRVVPIKDIKTFIQAARLVIVQRPEVEAWIVGPDEEDPDYAAECRELARAQGVGPRIKFLGFRSVDEILPEIGLNVLTSISEAQPLVVLEGFAAGVPCVATDVGCCRELVEGAGPEDRALGPAGAIVRIADPEATARSIVELLGDRRRWMAAQQAGIARVERSYTEALMLDRYRDLYRAAMGS